MKKFYMLCGVPASGKSTWIKSLEDASMLEIKGVKSNFPEDMNFFQQLATLALYGVYTVSTDRVIEDIAKTYRRTYDDCFKLLIGFAETQMHHELEQLVKSNVLNIVWDQTNLTPEVRAKKLDRIPAEYWKVAVNFAIPPREVLEKRLQSRIGKTIPANVMESMIARYVPATLAEDFNEVINVDTTQEIKHAND